VVIVMSWNTSILELECLQTIFVLEDSSVEKYTHNTENLAKRKTNYQYTI
jgi:hypothetical protein